MDSSTSAIPEGNVLAEPDDDWMTCVVTIDRYDSASANVRQIFLPGENIPRLIDLGYRLLDLMEVGQVDNMRRD